MGYQNVCGLVFLFLGAGSHCRHDKGRRIAVSYVVLQNHHRAGATLLGADVRLHVCIVNVPSEVFPVFWYDSNQTSYSSIYSFRREYMSVHNLIRKHSYLDLGYVYGTLSNAGGENPLDYAALARSPAELCVVAANAQNGEAQYFTKADLHPDDYRVLMASCCIPVIDQPCVIDGVPYFDGGLADPVPLEWAFAHGCDRVALILTKPIGLVSSDARDKHLAHLLQSHYPAAAEGLRRRAWRYNTAVQRARELERQGLVCIIAPDSTEGMSTLTKNRACLEKMYAKGKQDAEALVRWMQNTKQDESVGT